MRRHGYTLTEVLVTITIIGIMASMALPAYDRSVEGTLFRSASDVLNTIHTGEMVYAAISKGAFTAPSVSTFTWADIFMDDPNPADVSVTYTITLQSGGVLPTGDFEATATRGGAGSCAGKTRTIHKDRVLSPGPWTGNPSTC